MGSEKAPSHTTALTVLGGAATDQLFEIMMERDYGRIAALTHDVGNLIVGIP